MRELAAGMNGPLAPYQPSQRYYLLDAGRAADADLPPGNLVSAVVGLEKTRGQAARLAGPFKVLMNLLRSVDDHDLKQVFAAWLRALRASDRPPADGRDPLAELQETQTMLEENIREWTGEWLEKGRAEGLEQGIEKGRAQGLEQERALLCRQAARKFDAGAAEGLAAALAGVNDADRLARVGDWIIECATASELLARVRGDGRSDG